MAQVRQTVADALQWVKSELDQSVVRVREGIEQYIENPEDQLPLQRAMVELHQVRGTLSMVRCHGAAFLAEEMKNAVQDILQDRSKVQDAAFESLLGASLQLSDYIDLLSTGVTDCALVFQPQINELRVARGKGVFSESALFAHHLTAEPPQPMLPDLRQRPKGQAQPLALKLLPAYQVALLQWIKDQDIDLNLKRLGKIAEHVVAATRHNDVYQMWWLYSAVVEGMLAKGIEPALEIKRLFGQAGQQLKLLAEQGEDGDLQVSPEITYTLLYLAGRSTVTGPRTQAVAATYALDELLPPVSQLEQIRTRLRGPNTHLLQRLSEALKQDIASVKDSIDLVVRAGDKVPIQLDDTIATVDRIADTLAMLGLHMLQRVVMNQTKLIEQLRDGGSRDEKAWMEVAVALLRVEHSLDDALFRQIQQQGSGPAAETALAAKEEITPKADLRGGEAAIWREALVNVSRIKAQVKDYIDSGERAQMAEAGRQLNEIAAGFDIQGHTRLAGLVNKLQAFLLSSAVEKIRSDPALSSQLADAIVNLEYYLEALQQRHPHAATLEDSVAACIEVLRIPEPAPRPVPGPAIVAVAPTPAPQVPAKSGLTAWTDVDPEIRGVFLDEVDEVLGQLEADLQHWHKDIDNHERLSDIRRAFHTLKGSGRMVGATLIADFGWAHENMLNKCLDGAIAAGNPVVDAVRDAITLLPELIADLKKGGEPRPELIARAQALTERAGAASRGELGADAELYQVFRQDAQNKLAEVEQFLAKAGADFTPQLVESNIIRAFHTLKGSGEAVGATKLSQLAAEVEHFTESVRNASRPLGTDELRLLNDVVVAMKGLLAWMAGSVPVEPELKHIFSRLALLQQTIPTAAVQAATDHELVIIFTDEASDLLDGIQDSLKAWRQSPADNHHIRILKGLFHTLKGSSRTVQADAIGEVCEALERKVSVFTDGSDTPTQDLFAGLDATIDGVYVLLDRFRHGERVLDAAPLLAVLEEAATAPVVPVARPVVPPPTPLLAAGHEFIEMPQPPPAEDVIEMPEPPEAPAELEIDWGLAAQETSASPVPPVPLAPVQPVVHARAEPGPADAPFTEVDPELLEIFAGEAQELVEGIDSQLAQWEREADAVAPRRELLRALHTLKGSARMASVISMGDLSHELESLIGAVELGRRKADATFFAGLRNAVDAMHGVVDEINRGGTRLDVSAILADLRGEGLPAPVIPSPAVVQPVPAPPPAIPAVPIAPAAPIPPAAPIAPPPAIEPIRFDHLPVAPVAAPPPIPAPEEPALEEKYVEPVMQPAMEEKIQPVRVPVDTGPWAPQLFWQPDQPDSAIRAQQFETARVQVGQLDSMLNEAGEISIYRSRLEQQNTSFQFQLGELTQTIGRIRDQVRKLDFETQAQIQSVKEGARQSNDGGRYEEFDPLEMDRYSRLQEMSRALAESMTDLESLYGYMDELRGQNEMLLLQQARVNSELHQRLMRSLMVPFARQVQRLERIVRQTAQEDGKQARIEFTGVESELDRKVLERMVPPLEHLLRNAIVHGLEKPEDRRAVGKPETGNIAVQLTRDGPQLVIDVSDDGRGLNLVAIRSKAIMMGLIDAAAVLNEADIIQFIFEPGFSTAREVTQTAGRGVGMDVVNAEIKQLGGSIETRTTPGKGTHFIIRLPLSLTITQALLVHVAEEMYALPMNTIQGIARISRSELANYARDDGPNFAYGGHDYRVKQAAELLHLHEINIAEGDNNIPLLLVRAGERRVALAIDEVVGTREVVVKSVGLQVSSVVGVTGATVMADGRVVIILDAPALVQVRMRRALTAEVRKAAVPEAEDERPLVMVVDDSITMRRVAERTLVRNGFRVSTAKDGMDALGKLQIEFPQIVLLDIEMPRIDGFELATYMRNSEKLRSVPIIMITSRSGEKHRARAEQIGVNRYMIKPYQEDELISSIRELLDKDK